MEGNYFVRDTLSDRTADFIRRGILYLGNYKNEDHILEMEISEQLQVSRTNVHPALGLKPLDELSQPGVTLALQIVVVSARKPDVTTREEARLGTTKKAEQICA